MQFVTNNVVILDWILGHALVIRGLSSTKVDCGLERARKKDLKGEMTWFEMGTWGTVSLNELASR